MKKKKKEGYEVVHFKIAFLQVLKRVKLKSNCSNANFIYSNDKLSRNTGHLSKHLVVITYDILFSNK